MRFEHCGHTRRRLGSLEGANPPLRDEENLRPEGEICDESTGVVDVPCDMTVELLLFSLMLRDLPMTFLGAVTGEEESWRTFPA